MKPSLKEKIQVTLLKVLGKSLASCPATIPQWISIVLGDMIYFAPARLRRIILSNLHHAFPDKTLTWHKKIARESCRRTIELGLFVLASPFMSKKRIQCSFVLDNFYCSALEKKESYVILVPHFSGMEAITLTGLLLEGNIPKTGVIYRPFDNKAIEKYVKETRERGGVHLLSRKQGFTRAMEMLRNKNNIAILFDQNAGKQGSLTLFLDRIASTTELPGLLVQRFKCHCGILYTERTGFWKARIRMEHLSLEPSAHAVTLAANQWLENQLKENENICADWLWLHRRWKIQQEPNRYLHLHSDKNLLGEALHYQNKPTLPKKTRIWIRLPNSLADVCKALPLLRAIRVGRPDAELTLLVQASQAPLLETLKVADKLLSLPKKQTLAYFLPFFKWRQEFPDHLILLTNSLRINLEALILNPEASYGMGPSRGSCSFIKHKWHAPDSLALKQIHQTALWESWFQSMGLQTTLDYSPFELNTQDSPNQKQICLITGSENNPKECWSPHHWRESIGHLLTAYPEHSILLCNTAQDPAAMRAIATGFPSSRVINLSGKTNLLDFAKILKNSALVISNDTSGLHLANALGVPTIGLYGLVNPKCTGPIFDAPKIILQAPAGASIQRSLINRILPETVLQATHTLLNETI